MKNIYLCGFTGCGKTTVGKLLAERLGIGFSDTDREIENIFNKSVARIFSEDGEEAFRLAEREFLRKSHCEKPLVTATGGGMLADTSNAAYASKNGYVVFLELPFEECYRRIEKDKTRPLAVNMTEKELFKLYLGRTKCYRAYAEFTVDANCPPTVCVKNISKLICDKERRISK